MLQRNRFFSYLSGLLSNNLKENSGKMKGFFFCIMLKDALHDGREKKWNPSLDCLKQMEAVISIDFFHGTKAIKPRCEMTLIVSASRKKNVIWLSEINDKFSRFSINEKWEPDKLAGPMAKIRASGPRGRLQDQGWL